MRILPLAAPLLLLLTAAPARAKEPTLGARHPELRLPTIDGRTVSLRSLAGKRVLLLQFASW